MGTNIKNIEDLDRTETITMRFRIFPQAFIYCFLFFGAFNSIIGQGQPQAGERGFNPGRSYAVSDIETIGLYSGNVMFNMPLGSLPTGRGGISGAIGLNYNSKIWDTFVTEIVRFTTTHDKKVLIPSPEGGWKYNYKYYLKLDFRNLGSETGACTQGVDESYTIVKVQLVSPDGAQHVMHPGKHRNARHRRFRECLPGWKTAM